MPQISVICGPCAGGAAYSPSLGTLVMMVGAESQMFLTGPRVIARVTREIVTAAELGGPRVHRKSGCLHFEPTTTPSLGPHPRGAVVLPIASAARRTHRARRPAGGRPGGDGADQPRKSTTCARFARHFLDRGDFLEFGKRYARNMVVGFGHIEGYPVGVIANQPRYLGGTLDAAASDKGAWFVDMCDRFEIPLVVLSDTPGFRPGVRQEREAVLRRGAALLRAFSVAGPRVTIRSQRRWCLHRQNGGTRQDPRLPARRRTAMGAPQAIEIVHRRELEAGADAAELAAAYEEQHLPVAIAAKAGFIDEIVAPDKTRERIAAHFEARR